MVNVSRAVVMPHLHRFERVVQETKDRSIKIFFNGDHWLHPLLHQTLMEASPHTA